MGLWYRDGTVSVINGSPDIVCVGTLLLTQASVGDEFKGPDGVDYEITAIADDTHFAVKQANGTAAYAGTTASAQPYAILRNFTSTIPAQLASQLAALMTTYHVTLDELTAWLSGTGTITVHDAVGNVYSVQTPAAMNATLTGRLVKSVAGAADVTLTTAEAANLFIELTGTLTGNINVILPAGVRHNFILNNTSGAYTVTVKMAAGTGVAVTQGKRALLECDGTHVVNAQSQLNNATLTGTTQAESLTASGYVQTKYGDFSSPGVIVGDSQYGAYVSSTGVLTFKSSGGSVFAFRNNSDTGDSALISSAGATISGAVVGLSGSHSFKGNFSLICSDDSTAVYMSQGIVNAAGESAANSSVWLRKDATTSRSISAAGTLNASGADYAEYEHNNGLTFAKGDVVGFRPDGTLTALFADALRFGVKSTNPSYVGGDVWGSETEVGARPVEPVAIPEQPATPVLSLPVSPVQQPDETATTFVMRLAEWQQYCTELQAAHDAALAQHLVDLAAWQALNDAYNIAMPAYQAELAAFEARLESARQQVDRIAYSGKVPVNLIGAQPGDYLVATPASDGSITAVPVADPTFAQYKKSIGRVNRVLADGRAEVAVIVH
jgi:hypothetical protein